MAVAPNSRRLTIGLHKRLQREARELCDLCEPDPDAKRVGSTTTAVYPDHEGSLGDRSDQTERPPAGCP